jgi:hypothetical protein
LHLLLRQLKRRLNNHKLDRKSEAMFRLQISIRVSLSTTSMTPPPPHLLADHLKREREREKQSTTTINLRQTSGDEIWFEIDR